MKKIISLVFVLFITLTASAQYWYQYKTEADELKGTKASSYKAIVTNMGIITLDDKEDIFNFSLSEGQFDYESNGSFRVVDGLFGKYNESGELVGKEIISLAVSKSSPNFATTNYYWRDFKGANTDGIKKIATWIRLFKGSVRIVIPRYGRTDFDVRVPTMLSQKEPNTEQTKPKRSSQSRSTKKPVRKKK